MHSKKSLRYVLKCKYEIYVCTYLGIVLTWTRTLVWQWFCLFLAEALSAVCLSSTLTLYIVVWWVKKKKDKLLQDLVIYFCEISQSFSMVFPFKAVSVNRNHPWARQITPGRGFLSCNYGGRFGAVLTLKRGPKRGHYADEERQGRHKIHSINYCSNTEHSWLTKLALMPCYKLMLVTFIKCRVMVEFSTGLTIKPIRGC